VRTRLEIVDDRINEHHKLFATNVFNQCGKRFVLENTMLSRAVLYLVSYHFRLFLCSKYSIPLWVVPKLYDFSPFLKLKIFKFTHM